MDGEIGDVIVVGGTRVEINLLNAAIENPLIVTNTKDEGMGSLRNAISAANNMPGVHSIVFQIPVSDPGFIDVDAALAGGDAEPDVFRIQPLSTLPSLIDVTGGTNLDGRTQANFTGDTNPFGPEIMLAGDGLASDGLLIQSDANSVRGLIINGFAGAGVLIYSADHSARTSANNNVLQSNFIGVDAVGRTAVANAGNGIAVLDGDDNLIGGTTSQDANIISGNGGNGIFLGTTITAGGATNRTQIVGNRIGTNALGLQAIPNQGNGIHIQSGSQNVVGGSAAGSANLISGNAGSGVFFGYTAFELDNSISRLVADNNTLLGNVIGLNVNRDAALGNAGDGVTLSWGAVDNLIGGSSTSTGNTIAGNAGHGISITAEGNRLQQLVTWLDLSAWDAAQITAGGQSLSNVLGNIDAQVTGSGGASVASRYDLDMDAVVAGGNLEQLSFSFAFSQSFSAVLDVRSLDQNERLAVASAPGALTYRHAFGARPTLSANIELTGNGFRFGSLGSSRGIVELGMTNQLTWTYEALARNKFEAFRIGMVEPAAAVTPPCEIKSWETRSEPMGHWPIWEMTDRGLPFAGRQAEQHWGHGFRSGQRYRVQPG